MYDQIFSMHGITMIFWYAAPILTGFSVYLVPLMIGARDIAFPRMNSFTYLLFSREQYLAAAEAYMRGIERRLATGRDADVCSVASVFISRWDKAVMGKVPAELRDKLGIAIAQRTYKAYLELRNSERWQRLIGLGMRPQRLLWASTGTKDPNAPDTLYVKALAAHSPSTPCLMRHYLRSQTTAHWAS